MHVLELGKFAEVAVDALKPDLPSMEPVRELVPVANACTGSGSKVCGFFRYSCASVVSVRVSDG